MGCFGSKNTTGDPSKAVQPERRHARIPTCSLFGSDRSSDSLEADADLPIVTIEGLLSPTPERLDACTPPNRGRNDESDSYLQASTVEPPALREAFDKVVAKNVELMAELKQCEDERLNRARTERPPAVVAELPKLIKDVEEESYAALTKTLVLHRNLHSHEHINIKEDLNPAQVAALSPRESVSANCSSSRIAELNERPDLRLPQVVPRLRSPQVDTNDASRGDDLELMSTSSPCTALVQPDALDSVLTLESPVPVGTNLVAPTLLKPGMGSCETTCKVRRPAEKGIGTKELAMPWTGAMQSADPANWPRFEFMSAARPADPALWRQVNSP